MDFPDCLPILLSRPFLLFTFFCFPLFSCWFRAVDSRQPLIARYNSISYRIVSYRADGHTPDDSFPLSATDAASVLIINKLVQLW